MINKKAIFSLMLILSTVSMLRAEVLRVDAASTASSPDGASWATAYSDLSVALSSAKESDEIWVAAGEYQPAAGTYFAAKDGVSLYGGFHPVEAPEKQMRDWGVYETILKGNNSYVIFCSSSAGLTKNAYYDGFTITGGGKGMDLNGSGAYLRPGMHLVNCHIHHNKAKNGAVNLDGRECLPALTPSVVDCLIEYNEVVNGGGVYYNTSGLVSDCLIRNNTAGDGGGAYLNGNNSALASRIVLENSTLENNTANNGSAIFYRVGGVVRGCTVRNNTANARGAVYFNAAGILENTLVSDNKSSGDGGGVFAFYNKDEKFVACKSFIHGCTIVKNMSNGNGGGALVERNAEMVNCVVANNDARINGGGVWAQGASLVNCTVTRNKALFDTESDPNNSQQGLAGGVLIQAVEVDGEITQSATMRNCIVWGNGIVKSGENYRPFEQIYNIKVGEVYSGLISYSAIQGLNDPAVQAQVSGLGCVHVDGDNTIGPKFEAPSSVMGQGGSDIHEEKIDRYVNYPQSATKSTVFTAAQDGIHSYRIPAMVTTKSGALLVVCEARKKSWMDKTGTDVAVKRSTDGGVTWSAIKFITKQTGSLAYMDPTPVVDMSSGRIFVFSTCWSSQSSPATTNRAFMSYSDDDGITWSAPENVTPQVVAEGRYITGFGPGSGIQMRHPNYKGRLIVPSRQYNPETGSSETRTIYSDNGGLTWLLGEASTPTGELQMAEMPDGTLTVNIRAKAGRRVGYSYNGGVTWGAVSQDPTLVAPDNGCQGSVMGNEQALFFTSPKGGPRSSGRDDRYDLAIWRSLTNGKTWGQQFSLYENAAGYSCISMLPDGRIAIVFESADGKGFITSATRGAGWMRIDVIVLPADISDPKCWITKDAPKSYRSMSVSNDSYAGIDWSLTSISPLINKGNDSYNELALDIAGNTRIVGAAIDMGAYEYQIGLGVGEQSGQERMVVYPNPVIDRVYFEVETDVEVYSLIGTKLLSSQGCTSLDLSSLKSGVYVCKLTRGVVQTTTTLIKE